MESKPESRTERKKEETQNRILRVAVELFNQHGLEAVTMEQIAAEVDIAKGTLYNYYPSKEAIINAFIQGTFRQRNPDRVQAIRQLADTPARLTRIFGLLVEGVQAQKQIFEAFMVYRMKQVISFRPPEGEQSGLSTLIHEIISLGQESGELRRDLPDEVLEGLFEYTIIAAIRPFYLDPQTFDPQRSIEQCVDVFMNGAKA
jgi:AcrR family transcriptional regulator